MSLEKLLKLEETGIHLFHGSGDGSIEVLEPRQGNHVPDLNNPNETILDGQPAVSATPHAEIAAFRAMVNRKNVPFDHTASFGITDGEKVYGVSSEKVLDEVKDKKGFVYFFDKDNFEPYSREGKPGEHNMEWRSYVPVKPVEVVEVSSQDLPPKIEILQ